MKTRFLLASAALLALAGCSSTHDVSADGVNRNLTPELRTLNERPSDVDRHVWYTQNVNKRLFWEDLGRVFYYDHPSRLSPVDIPGVSGKPH